VHVTGDSYALSAPKIWQNSKVAFWRKMGSNIYVIDPISILRTCGAQTPDLTHELYSLWGPDTGNFGMGGIGPHLGQMGA